MLAKSATDLDEYVIGTHKPEYAYINSLKNFGSLILGIQEKIRVALAGRFVFWSCHKAKNV